MVVAWRHELLVQHILHPHAPLVLVDGADRPGRLHERPRLRPDEDESQPNQRPNVMQDQPPHSAVGAGVHQSSTQHVDHQRLSLQQIESLQLQQQRQRRRRIVGRSDAISASEPAVNAAAESPGPEIVPVGPRRNVDGAEGPRGGGSDIGVVQSSSAVTESHGGEVAKLLALVTRVPQQLVAPLVVLVVVLTAPVGQALPAGKKAYAGHAITDDAVPAIHVCIADNLPAVHHSALVQRKFVYEVRCGNAFGLEALRAMLPGGQLVLLALW
mmetsp:Transcript_93193/g.240827  ORF Transcript_93193/g.240827 Transcript_93193/m.240827 type:complete len:270 (-) Transcript_93193:452-1261(-)